MPSCIYQVFHISRQDVRCLERESPGRKTLRSSPEKPQGKRIALNSAMSRRDRGWQSAEWGIHKLVWHTGSWLGCLAGWPVFCHGEAVLAEPPRGTRRAMPVPLLWTPWPWLAGGAGKAASSVGCGRILACGSRCRVLQIWGLSASCPAWSLVCSPWLDIWWEAPSKKDHCWPGFLITEFLSGCGMLGGREVVRQGSVGLRPCWCQAAGFAKSSSFWEVQEGWSRHLEGRGTCCAKSHGHARAARFSVLVSCPPCTLPPAHTLLLLPVQMLACWASHLPPPGGRDSGISHVFTDFKSNTRVS